MNNVCDNDEKEVVYPSPSNAETPTAKANVPAAHGRNQEFGKKPQICPFVTNCHQIVSVGRSFDQNDVRTLPAAGRNPHTRSSLLVHSERSQLSSIVR